MVLHHSSRSERAPGSEYLFPGLHEGYFILCSLQSGVPPIQGAGRRLGNRPQAPELMGYLGYKPSIHSQCLYQPPFHFNYPGSAHLCLLSEQDLKEHRREAGTQTQGNPEVLTGVRPAPEPCQRDQLLSSAEMLTPGEGATLPRPALACQSPPSEGC